MTIFRADRVWDTGTGEGTGAITLLDEAPDTYVSVAASGMAEGQQAPFLLIQKTTKQWEISLCTLTSGTLVRDEYKAPLGGTFKDFDEGEFDVELVPAAADVVTRDDGLNYAARIDVASATTCDIGAAAGNWLRITGTTTIASLGTPSAGGYWRWLEFGGALTLTNNAAIVIYGDDSVTTQAGMMALALYDAVGTAWKVWILPSLVAAAADVWLGTNNFKYASPKSLMDAAAPVTVAYAATVTLDLTTGFNFEIGALTGNLTLANPSAGITPGRSGSIGLTQDGTGSRTLTLGSYWKCFGGAPTASTPASSVDTLFYEVIDSTHIRCSLSKAAA